MTRLLLFCISVPFVSLAQPSDSQLSLTQSLLMINQRKAQEYYWATNNEKMRLDTLSNTSESTFRQAERYRYLREFDKAVPFYEKAAQLNPKRQGYIGYVYLAFLHDYPRALRHLNNYDALTANFDDVEGNNPVSYYRGVIYLKTGEYAQAIEQLNRSIGDIENKHGAEWVNYRYYLSRAKALLATNQPEKALADIDKAIANAKKSALAYYLRGLALQQLGRIAEAKSAFQDAQFFFRANRAEVIRVKQAFLSEDQFFSLYEPEIEEALASLNK